MLTSMFGFISLNLFIIRAYMEPYFINKVIVLSVGNASEIGHSYVLLCIYFLKLFSFVWII